MGSVIRFLLTGLCTLIAIASTTHAQTVDYYLKLKGPRTVFAGNDLWAKLIPTYDGTPTLEHMYFTSVEGLPYGSTYELWCNSYQQCMKDTKRQQQYQWQGISSIQLRIRTSINTQPGTHYVIVTTEKAGVRKQLQIPLTVMLPPTSVVKGTPTAFPWLPGTFMSKWQSTMLTLGKKWCDTSQVYAFGVESEVWYYDGARVYFQIADYTNDRSWEACALNIARQYRDYIVNNKGAIPGWRVFGNGLRMAYERTGDVSFRDAAILLSTNSAYAPHGGDIDDRYIRETAYILNAYIQAERLGHPRNQQLAKAANLLIGHFDILFNWGSYTIHQTFFDGIAAEALISYYELTGDPRVPAVIKQMLDWMWMNAWTGSGLIVNPEAVGSKCEWGCMSPDTALINLTVPAFSWYASVTGDLTYLNRGDALFLHSLDNDISYSGKIFSQNFKWSYLQYREHFIS